MTDKPKRPGPRPRVSKVNDSTFETDLPIDQTVELSDTALPRTLDPNATVDVGPGEVFDPYSTDIASPPAPDSRATGATTIVPSPSELDSPAPIDSTIAFGDIDKTVNFTPVKKVEKSNQKNRPAKKTIPILPPDKTVELGVSDTDCARTEINFGTTSTDLSLEPPSIMNDTNVTQTINPRELSEEDAAFWGDLSRSSASQSEASRLSPAINRSLSETKLHLRGQLVSEAHSELAKQSDYRLVRLLGKGGMGNVYVARQGSLDRLVALKVIKPLEEEKKKRFRQRGNLEKVEQERRLQFISEAVVTGDLDHPNIVPIHDIAVTGDNTLFYSMKRVSGTPWSKVIDEKSRDENIDILLKVCDAIGFAHTRGVVHRDIKPENIMLGEFGVVMVMDWGLALAKPEFEKLDSVHQSTGLGGSPAYMAPEMAMGPIEKIGPESDIYLLGATLFQIITSWAPHYASNVSECLKAVSNNTIRPVPKQYQGELLGIALKAMATRPEDRYRDVLSFQQAIRDYRSHGESIAIATRAQDDLERACKTQSYDDFSRSIFGFEEAAVLWPGNSKAIEGIATAKLLYAEAAHSKGDYDLGLSLLDRNHLAHQPLIEQLETGKKERIAKVTRLSLLRKVAAAMLAFIIFGGAAATYAIYQRSQAAIKAKGLAEISAENERAQKLVAEQQTLVAEQRTKEALDAKQVADEAKKVAETERENAVASAKAEAVARQEERTAKEVAQKAASAEALAKKQAVTSEAIAVKAKDEAEGAKELAIYESYVSKIGLAKAHIDQNEFDEARGILNELKEASGGNGLAWEWRWLWRQTTQAASTLKLQSPARQMSFSPANGTIATVLENGSLQFFAIGRDSNVSSIDSQASFTINNASAVSLSPDQQFVFVGSRSGDIEVWDWPMMTKELNAWTAHKTTINRLQFFDNTLISASDDNSIRAWDVDSQSELASCWNLGPVKDFAVAARGSSVVLVAAVAENTSGRAVVWQLEPGSKQWQSKLIGEFMEHDRPVLSVDLSRDGDTVVSADTDGKVFLWNASEARITDYKKDIENAIRKLSSTDRPNQNGTEKRPAPSKTPFRTLVNPDLKKLDVQSQKAHSDRVRVVRFSRDGKRILSGGDDYAIQLWDTKTTERIKALRGHGGWILDARFAGESEDVIVSVSTDSTIRTWKPKSYVTAAVPTKSTPAPESPLHREEILSARLNATGDAIVTGSRDRTAVVSRIDQDSLTLQRIVEFRDDADAVSLKEGTQFIAQSFATDLENGTLYIASADGIVRVWDLVRGTERFQIKSAGLNASLALSRNAAYLLTRSSTGDAKSILWRVDPTRNNAPRISLKLVGHANESAVTALAISADGSKLFTADNVGIGILWDGKTGKQIGEKIETLRGYRINAAEFSSDGSELLIAADDQQLTRIDLQTRSVVSQLNHTGFVTSLSLSQNDAFALTISEQTTATESQITATLWDLATGAKKVVDRAISPLVLDKQSKQKREHKRITSAQFSPDGRTFAIGKQTDGDGAGRVVVWSVSNVNDAKPIHAFELPSNLGAPQACVPLVEDRMLTLNGDAAFQWSLGTKDSPAALHLLSYRANAAVHHANFSFDSDYVVTGSHTVKVWSVMERRAVAKVELPHEGPLTCVEFTPKAASYELATSGADGVVKLLRFDEAKLDISTIRTWFDGDKLPSIRRVCFSEDGMMLLAVGDRGTIRLISLVDGSVIDHDTPDAGDLIAAAFSTDGRYFVVGGGKDNDARLWSTEVHEGDAERFPIVLKGHAGQIEDVRFMASESAPLRVFTASRDKSARVWDPRINSPARLGREVLNLREHSLGVTSIDTTIDGNLMITAGRDAEVVLWPASQAEDPSPVQPR